MSNLKQLDRMLSSLATAEWDESAHPRADNGQFGESGGKISVDKLLVSKKSFDGAMRDNASGRGPRTSGPVELHRLDDGRHLLIDGHHRLAQLVKEGGKYIEAKVISSGYTDYATPHKDDELFSQQTGDGKSEQAIDDFRQSVVNAHPRVTLSLTKSGEFLVLDKIAVPKELRGQGIGTKVMEKVVEYADQHGLKMALTDQADKGYKETLREFYKGFGFVPNKGRYMDFTTSESMTRQPKPSAAPTVEQMHAKIDAMPEIDKDHRYNEHNSEVSVKEVYSQPTSRTIYGLAKTEYLKRMVDTKLPIDQIAPSQYHLDRESLKKYVQIDWQKADKTDLPIVVKNTDGKYIASDHRRIAAQAIQGFKEARVRLIEHVGGPRGYEKPEVSK